MVRHALVPVALCLLACLLACLPACHGAGGDASGFPMSGGPSTPASAGDGSSTGTSTSTSAVEDSTAGAASSMGSSTGADTTGPFLDQGTMPDFGGKAGCKGKIDFLFAISSDPSMEDAQERLKDSFEGFIGTIKQDFADFDYHIMVANTGGFIEDCAGCQDVCPSGPPDYPCGAQFYECDKTYGAGVTFPTGWNASNQRCILTGGNRYILKEEPYPLGAFMCIASVGTSGANGVVQHGLQALSDGLETCNDGFLRDDALLVVTIITRGDDYGSQGQPPDWTKALLEAKGGDPDAAVVLVVMDDSDLPDGVCKPYEDADLRLRALSKLLPHALTGSVCAASYAPFFADAAALVKQQCENFVPQ